MALKSEYMMFYVNGRGEDVFDDDVDTDDLADKVMAGADLRETIAKVADSIAAPLLHDKEKREWIAENKTEITEAGGDAEEAYRHYLEGRKDQYAHALEDDIVEAMFEEDEENEDDAEEDDDDDEEDDDE
jgi:hypothetical protein